MVDRIKHPKAQVKIALVGKYIELKESYKSLCEALTHGGLANHAGVQVVWVDAEELQKGPVERLLKEAQGVLVPGGFGSRGIEGKIAAIRYAREAGVPFLGICLGMQCAVVEFSRHVAGLSDANSSEFDPKTPYPVIDLIPAQKAVDDKGGTMRLGAYPCEIRPGTLAHRAYQASTVSERHRHRYELNNQYRDVLNQAGLVISGLYPKEQLAEIVELPNHPWFLATQFHPEFHSRPRTPHPLFREFIRAALAHKG